jgi:hypothetical protein
MINYEGRYKGGKIYMKKSAMDKKYFKRKVLITIVITLLLVTVTFGPIFSAEKLVINNEVTINIANLIDSEIYQPYISLKEKLTNLLYYFDPKYSENSVKDSILSSREIRGQPAANLDQIRNGPADTPWDPAEWVNGNAGSQNSHYVEGGSIRYRCRMTNLPTDGTVITLTLGYDIKHGDRHAIDYLTHYDNIKNYPWPHMDVFGHPAETVDPLADVTGVSGTISTYQIPIPDSTNSPIPGEPASSWTNLTTAIPDGADMTLFGGTISDVYYLVDGDLTASQSETQINIVFTVDSATAVLAWGGHIASRLEWGYDESGDPRSAGGLTGSPYHMRLINWNLNNLGQQDRSLKVSAVYAPPGFIIIHKDAIPDDPQDFQFTSLTLTPSPFYLDDDGGIDPTYENMLSFGPLEPDIYDVAEVVPPGWDLTDVMIVDPTGDSTSISDLQLASGETIHVYFENTKRGCLEVEKFVDWKGVTPDLTQTFTICIEGPSYPGGDCYTFGQNGGIYTWTDLIPGDYVSFMRWIQDLNGYGIILHIMYLCILVHRVHV